MMTENVRIQYVRNLLALRARYARELTHSNPSIWNIERSACDLEDAIIETEQIARDVGKKVWEMFPECDPRRELHACSSNVVRCSN